MENQIQITFHNTPHSKKAKELVAEKIDKLESRFRDITSCKVVIDKPHKHGRKGNEYVVEVVMSIPHILATGHAHNEYMYTALSDAIDAAAKRISKSIDKRRSKRVAKPKL